MEGVPSERRPMPLHTVYLFCMKKKHSVEYKRV